jgi:hypothetical protein
MDGPTATIIASVIAASIGAAASIAVAIINNRPRSETRPPPSRSEPRLGDHSIEQPTSIDAPRALKWLLVVVQGVSGWFFVVFVMMLLSKKDDSVPIQVVAGILIIFFSLSILIKGAVDRRKISN